MGTIVLFGLFIAAVIVGAPIAIALGIGAVGAFIYANLPLALTFQSFVSGISALALMAIPFFIFAGELMLQGGIAGRLVRLASALVGRVRGGLGVVDVTTCLLFGGITGSSVADTSALGSVLMPEMKKKGYDTDYAVNCTVTASTTGCVVPPSHNMLLYVVAAGGASVSIDHLFLAGIVPGILLALCLAVASFLVAVKRGYPKEPFPGFMALLTSFIVSLPGLLTAIIIVGGVLTGVMTVVESGAIGAIYAIVAAVLAYRELTWAGFKTAVARAIRTTSLVMLLVGCAAMFGYMLALFRVPAEVANFLTSITDNPFIILLLVNLILLALGMIMDMAPLILICTPIFLPVVESVGMDPVQFGVVMMMNLAMGLCTPPVGSCLFVGCAIGDIPIEETTKTIWPFYLAILVALALTTYVPALTMTLPHMFG